MKNSTKYLVCIWSVVVITALLSYGGGGDSGNEIPPVVVVPEEGNLGDTLEGVDGRGG